MSNLILDYTAKAEEESNFLEKTGEFIYHGIPDAIISAGVSFYNTGVALGNVFGAEGERLDTEDVIEDWLGEDKADYYTQNRGVVDTVGLVAGSLLPGTIAIRAGRAFAAGTLATRQSKLATAIRDVALPDKRIATWTNHIKSTDYSAIGNANRLKLAAQNFGQQAADAAIYEAATLLTMNQSGALAQPEMTRGELGYVEAIAKNLDTAALGVVFGGAIGGGIGYLTEHARLKNVIRSVEHELADKVVTLKTKAAPIMGDEAAVRLEKVFSMQSRLDQIGKLPTAQREAANNEFTALTNSISSNLNDIEKSLNKNSTQGTTLGSELIRSLKKVNDTYIEYGQPSQLPVNENLYEVVAGSTSLQTLSNKDVTTGIVSRVTPEQEANDILPLFTSEIDEGLVLDDVGKVAVISDKFKSGEIADVDKFLQASGMLAAQDISAIWEKSRVRVNYKDAFGHTVPDPTNPVTKKGNIRKYASAFEVQDTLAAFAYKFDENYKRNYDSYKLNAQSFLDLDAELRKTKAVKLGVTGKQNRFSVVLGKEDFTPEYLAKKEAIGEAHEAMERLNDPANLFGVAFREFNRADLSLDVKKAIDGYGKEFRPLYEWMANNKQLNKKYGTKSAYIDLESGSVYNGNPSAVVSDLGPVSIQKKSVVAGRNEFPIAALNPIEMTTAAASAQYAHSTSNSVLHNLFEVVKPAKSGDLADIRWNKSNIAADDLPRLQALLENGILEGQRAVLKSDAGDVVITTNDQLLQHVRKTKEDIIKRLARTDKSGGTDSASGKFHSSEVAIYADVSESYVEAVQAGLSSPWDRGEEFLTNSLRTVVDGEEVIRPKTVKVNYDAQRFKEDGSSAITQSDVIARINAKQQTNENYTTMILGKHADNFPIATTMRNGEMTVASDITTVDDTTSFVKSFTPDPLSGGSFFQSIGASVRSIFIKEADEIKARLFKQMEAGEASKEAIAEMSVLQQSILRNNKYTFMSESVAADMFDEDVAQFYKDALNIDIDTMLQKHLYDKLDIADSGKAIISRDAADKLLSSVSAQVRYFPELEDVQKQLAELDAVIKANPEDITAIDTMQKLLSDTRTKVVAEMQQGFDNAAVNLADDATGAGKQIFGIKTNEVADFLRAYNAANQEKLVKPINLLANADGNAQDLLDKDVIYPGRFDSARFPHKAYVTYTGAERDAWKAKGSGLLVAHSPDALQQKVKHMEKKYGSNVIVQTEAQRKDSLLAKKQYDATLAATDTFVDQELKKEGKLWNLSPEPDPLVFKTMINSMIKQRENVIRRTVSLRYGQEFGALEQLDKIQQPYKATDKSKNVTSSFTRHINQALAISEDSDYTLWKTAQQISADAVAKARGALRGGFVQAKLSGDWETFSNAMEQYGMPKVYEHAEDFILSNASAPKDVLNKLSAQSNSVFNTLMLRMDTAQATVNAMATPIMLFPAIKALRESIKNVDPERLKRLDIALSAPIDDSGRRMPTNLKIMQQASANLFKKDKSYWDEYVKRDIVGSDVHELKQAIDAAAYTSDAGKWKKGLNKAVDFVSTPTDMSEKLVKYFAADSARQVIDGLGLSSSHSMYWPIIKAFTTQVVGNYNAAQRPALFQGWAGQAVGLFQTYQFNLFQQFMRHVENGNGAAKYMMAYQAGIFGAQSVPGFQLMNQHIAEKTLGEKDFYSTTEETFDSPVSEFILYGGGSSLTRPLTNGKGIDFFNRGDLTPRTPIIIPTSFSEVPSVSFLSKTISNMATAMDNLGNGAPIGQTMLQALASNGVNRPIAGAFQLIQGQKLTAQGNTLVEYPEIDWATRVAKYMGSKTLNEGIMTNAYYRAQGYRNARLEDLQDLGESVKVKVRAKGGLEGDEYTEIMKQYMGKGGNIKTFRRWMMNNYANADNSNIRKMYDNLNNAEGRYMQRVIGGRVEEFEEIGDAP